MNSSFPINDDQIRSIAEQIALSLANGPRSNEIDSIRNSLDQISSRLEKLESMTSAKTETAPVRIHPSQDRFEIAEAIVDRLFENAAVEKACTFEPNKACDHCSMCSSRGF
jgi:hypothetical protein